MPRPRPDYASLDTWRSPVLLIHGDDDRNVFFSQTVFLVEELRERGVHVEQLVFPDEVHGFLLHRNWVRAYDATIDFFDRMLRAPLYRRVTPHRAGVLPCHGLERVARMP